MISYQERSRVRPNDASATINRILIEKVLIPASFYENLKDKKNGYVPYKKSSSLEGFFLFLHNALKKKMIAE